MSAGLCPLTNIRAFVRALVPRHLSPRSETLLHTRVAKCGDGGMPLSTFDMSMKPEPHPARPQNARGCCLSHALEIPPSRRVSSHLPFLIVRVVLLLLLTPSPPRLPLHCCYPGFLSVSSSPSGLSWSIGASLQHQQRRENSPRTRIDRFQHRNGEPFVFPVWGTFGSHFLDPGTGG